MVGLTRAVAAVRAYLLLFVCVPLRTAFAALPLVAHHLEWGVNGLLCSTFIVILILDVL